MDSKTIMLVALCLGLLAAGCLGSGNSSYSTPTTMASGGSTSQYSGTGVFSLSDPSPQIANAGAGEVTSVKVTVQDVQVHSQTQGWVTVSSTPQTVDLLSLNASGKQQLIASADMAADTYDQLRLDISSVTVVDGNGSHDAKLPSGTLEFAGQMIVWANQTSAANFDFNAQDSIHVTGDGKYIMAPVMHVTTVDNASVQVGDDGSVTQTGGSVDTDEDIGMDASGNVGVGVSIPVDAQLDLGDNGTISIVAGNASTIGGVVTGGLNGTLAG